jgi:outer membrane protein OmpA-like peptidoglycan-associated protein
VARPARPLRAALLAAALASGGATVALARSTLAAVDPLPASRPVVTALPASRVEIGRAQATAVAAVERLRSELNATETERGTVITLPGDVLFDFDKAAIRRDAVPALEKLAELIRLTPERPVAVEGHTDSKGRDAYNLELSRRRARAVAEWLARRPGVGRDRLREEGRGEAEPLAPNERPDGSDDPDGRQRNRRVEVVLERR